MTQIIGIAGKIGSGKTTLSRYLHGYFMKNLIPNPMDHSIRGIVSSYMIDETGHLLLPSQFEDGEDYGIFDPESRDPVVIDFLQTVVWPYIKTYSFAGYLKRICKDLFGATDEQLYGTQEQKATPIEGLLWENMSGTIVPENNRTKKVLDLIESAKLAEKSGPMTSRDLLQYFGTDVCRRLNNKCWAAATISQIKSDEPDFAIVPDVRFADTEVAAIKDNGGLVVYLTRDQFPSDHASENGVSQADCDIVIDNANMTIQESCETFIASLKEKQIL